MNICTIAQILQTKSPLAVCGKYVKHQDAYKSVEEALRHSAAFHKRELVLKWVDSERNFKPGDLNKEFADVDGILSLVDLGFVELRVRSLLPNMPELMIYRSLGYAWGCRLRRLSMPETSAD
jgi:CTP synthase (UTP-ammonia lyase)